MKKTLDLKMFGEKTIALNTASLDQKIEAFHAMEIISENMGKSFFPFLEPTLKIITEYFTFSKSREIRETAMKTLKHLLMACDTEDKMAIVFNAALP